MGKYLIGSHSARFDKSGRIKIPEKFRALIEEKYGKGLFITSLDDKSVQIYPFSVWERFAGSTENTLVAFEPEIRDFMIQVYQNGSYQEIDMKGRVLIKQEIKDTTGLEDEVKVIGMHEYLEVWSPSRLKEKFEKNPLTKEDFKRVSQLSPRGSEE